MNRDLVPPVALHQHALSVVLAGVLSLGVLSERAVSLAQAEQRAATPAAEAEPVTFNREIAPIVFGHCAICHRPGGAGPFPLLTYQDVTARADLILKVTESRFMPPWKPEPGYGDFAGTRRLSDEQIQLIRQWVQEGMIEGDLATFPPLPEWSNTWWVGEPDLVIRMPQPYMLRAEGPDMFRAFVISIPTSVRQYVRAWEFIPGNSTVVHHATMLIDSTRASRRLDDEDPEPGYEGLVPHSAQAPDGYFLGWTPGQAPYVVPEDIAWPIEKDSDLVMMLHLRPTGRIETVQASLGLYFSETRPTRMPAAVRLTRQDLDIPAGASGHTVTDRYTLPVDVEAYSVQPHAHYLATAVKAFAILPDGTTQWLIFIKDWEFDWQDVYRFATPVFLPAGSTVVVEWMYDNSAANPRNPHHPPRRVTYGQKTSDEMCELWLQVLPRHSADRLVLTREIRQKVLPQEILGLEAMLKADPDQISLHDDVALLYAEAGDLDRAAAHFGESLRLQPHSAAARYNVGAALLARGARDQAGAYFQQALEVNPDYANAHHGLGIVLQAADRLEEAAAHYGRAIQIGPSNADAHYNLGVVRQAQGKLRDAISQYQEALRVRPDHTDAHYNLGLALQADGQLDLAAQHYRKALQSKPDWPAALVALAGILATSPAAAAAGPGEAVHLAERAATLTNYEDVMMLDVLATALAASGQFEKAVLTAQKALTEARAAQDEETATRMLERLELFRQHRW